MKKKLMALTMILCLLITMGLTGCGSKDNPYEGLNFEEYVKLADYKGLEREEIRVSVSDEEVQTQINANLKETAETVEKTYEIPKATFTKSSFVSMEDWRV